MEIYEKLELLKKLDSDFFDTKMLFNVMLSALKYLEMEKCQGSSIICLCELINERLENTLDSFDNILHSL